MSNKLLVKISKMGITQLMLLPFVLSNLFVHVEEQIKRKGKIVVIRISKNVPRKSRLRGQYTSDGAILYHLLDSGQKVDISRSFKITNKKTALKFLHFAEIKRFRLD